jgi:hypothetical protein
MSSQHGISALLTAGEAVTDQILDLAAVLAGLVDDKFEIIVLTSSESEREQLAEEMRVRAPALPLRLLVGQSAIAGCDAAVFDLIFLASADGRFDLSELNRLLDAIERGADIAAGYRPGRVDPIFRGLQRLGLNVGVDCAFALIRRSAVGDLDAVRQPTCGELVLTLRRLGYRVAEIPVSQARPTTGLLVSGVSRAA